MYQQSSHSILKKIIHVHMEYLDQSTNLMLQRKNIWRTHLPKKMRQKPTTLHSMPKMDCYQEVQKIKKKKNKTGKQLKKIYQN